MGRSASAARGGASAGGPRGARAVAAMCLGPSGAGALRHGGGSAEGAARRAPSPGSHGPLLPGGASLEPPPGFPWTRPASSDACPLDSCHRDWCRPPELGGFAGDCPLLHTPHAPLAAAGCRWLGADPEQ